MSSRLFDVLAPMRVRCGVAYNLTPKELVALAIATTSSVQGRGISDEHVLVYASQRVVSVCARSWLWEVRPWDHGVWTGTGTPCWSGPPAGKTNLKNVAWCQWRHEGRPRIMVVPNSYAEIGYTLLMIGDNVGRYRLGYAHGGEVRTSHDGGITWKVIHANAPFEARQGFASVVVPRRDGYTIIMTGGTFRGNYYSDVWASDDVGQTWGKVTGEMGGGTRSRHSMCVLSPQKGRRDILMVGGTRRRRLFHRDVWRSGDMGQHWECVRNDLECMCRWSPGLVAVADPTCVGGCRVLLIGGGAEWSNVWVSVDRGHSWEMIEDDVPFRGISTLHTNPVSVIPRIDDVGDVVLVLNRRVDEIEAWINPGGDGKTWNRLSMGRVWRCTPTLAVVSSHDGWNLVIAGVTRLGGDVLVQRGILQ